MTELNNAKKDEAENSVLSFGEHLYFERKKQNLSVTEVAKAIHLSEKVIDAIERSDVAQLPQPAFVQGYLRVYAKFLGISEALVLQEYANAVPHKLEADLHPRSTLPSEASSNSPLVKMVTVFVFVMMLVTAIYASFSYYKNAIVVNEPEIESQSLLALPESSYIEQNDIGNEASSSEDEVIVSDQDVVQQEIIVKSEVTTSELPIDIVPEQVLNKVSEDNANNQKPINQLIVKGDDILELSAAQVSWVEVNDANAQNLYFDLLQQDQRITLKGTAPFKVFLGNAPYVVIKMNDVKVNADKYIRSNNIAHFSISVDQQQVVFH